MDEANGNARRGQKLLAAAPISADACRARDYPGFRSAAWADRHAPEPQCRAAVICNVDSLRRQPVSILWIIIIGFIAGVIARLLAPGPNNPTGFILTMVLGIVGAFVATFLGQAIGWYRPGESAGLIGATVGAVIVLFVWHRLVVNHTISDPGFGGRP
jgi:uncharacterized membrane protein YeaQ/YmgE (transglycosylase-associated protein family)